MYLSIRLLLLYHTLPRGNIKEEEKMTVLTCKICGETFDDHGERTATGGARALLRLGAHIRLGHPKTASAKSKGLSKTTMEELEELIERKIKEYQG